MGTALFHYIGAGPAKGPAEHYVMLATPVTHNPAAIYTKSMVATAETLSRFGVQFDFHMVQGACHVDDVRNGIIRNFLQWRRPPGRNCLEKFTDLFWLDSDMGWDAEAVLRLLQVPGDVVAGVYSFKNDTTDFPFQPGDLAGQPQNEHGLFEMPKAATGFMRMRREVLEKLYEEEKTKHRVAYPNDEDRRTNPMPVARIVERVFPREAGLL